MDKILVGTEETVEAVVPMYSVRIFNSFAKFTGILLGYIAYMVAYHQIYSMDDMA